MARLTDVDVDFISLVKKGANKQQIQIYKSDDFIEDKSIEKEKTEENKSSKLDGLFDVIKSYFTKADDKEIKVTTFSSRIGNRELRSSMWDANDALIDTFYDIMNSDATNQEELLTQAVDEYAAYLKSKIVAGKIEKSFIEKSDEKGSKSKHIKNIKIGKEDKQMTKEEMKEVLDAVITPLTERLDKLEGVEVEGEEKPGTVEKSVKEEFSEVLKEVLQPLTERVETIEKARGISNQIDEEENHEDIKKTGSVFAGLDI